jgi:hypothetical protein
LELDQEHIAKEKAREKETAEEDKEEPSRKSTVKVLAKGFVDLTKLLKQFANMDPNVKSFPLNETDVHGALSTNKQIYDDIRKKPYGHISAE